MGGMCITLFCSIMYKLSIMMYIGFKIWLIC